MGRLKPQRLSDGKKIAVQPQEQGSSNRETPVFCLKYMDDYYGLEECQPEDRAAFAMTLAKLAAMTWGEINQSSRHASGTEKIPLKQIRGKRPAHVTEDTRLLAFRFSAMKPMVGYRENAIFHIIWLDHDYSLYSH